MNDTTEVGDFLPTGNFDKCRNREGFGELVSSPLHQRIELSLLSRLKGAEPHHHSRLREASCLFNPAILYEGFLVRNVLRAASEQIIKQCRKRKP